MDEKRQRQQGFTLIEVMAVLVIMGVAASVGVQHFSSFSSNAELTALQSALRELNIRESLTWSNLKLGSVAWGGDAAVWDMMDTDLGTGYRWAPDPSDSGGTLYFRSRSMTLTRIQATESSAAFWKQAPM